MLTHPRSVATAPALSGVGLSGDNKKFQSLDVLRAVCALIVFGNHLSTQIAGFRVPPPLSMVFNYATEAVVCFFVLSGCVIALQDYRSIRHYLVARAVRILPAYYIALGFTIAVMLIAAVPPDLATVLGNIAFLQSLQGLVVPPLPYDVPLWSLSYEVTFYGLFAIILLKPGSLPLFFLASVTAGVAGYFYKYPPGLAGHMLQMLSLFCFWLAGKAGVDMLRAGRCIALPTGCFLFVAGICLGRVSLSGAFYDFSRLAAFALGCAALCSSMLGAELSVGGEKRLQSISLAIGRRVAIAAAIAPVLWFGSASLPATKLLLTVTMLAAALAPDAIVGAVRRAASLALRPLLFVASISYALYVIHYPMIRLVDDLHLAWPPLFSVALAIVLSLLASYVIDCWLRGQIRRLKRLRPLPAAP